VPLVKGRISSGIRDEMFRFFSTSRGISRSWNAVTSVSFEYHYSAASETQLKEALAELHPVGLVRRKKRHYKGTYATHIFSQLVKPGQDWDNEPADYRAAWAESLNFGSYGTPAYFASHGRRHM
jgi:hypothetical protein